MTDTTVLNELAALPLDSKVKDCVAKINEIIERINAQPIRSNTRDYGPSSTRKMDREDAWRVRFGDLKSTSVKDIANELGLSKGQIYSVRGNYTFRDIKEDEFEIDVDNIDDELVKEFANIES